MSLDNPVIPVSLRWATRHPPQSSWSGFHTPSSTTIIIPHPRSSYPGSGRENLRRAHNPETTPRPLDWRGRARSTGATLHAVAVASELKPPPAAADKTTPAPSAQRQSDETCVSASVCGRRLAWLCLAAMAAATVATAASPASRRLPTHPLSASTAAPSLLRLAAGTSRRLRRVVLRVSAAAAEEPDVLPGPGDGEREAVSAGRLEDQPEVPLGGGQLDIGGLAFQGDMGGGFAGGGGSGGAGVGGDGGNKMLDRGINTAIVLGASTYALTKLLTVDQDYWHGWTIFEILRYMPEHNWSAYEEALKTNPVLAKMMISGVVYSLGDWIAQCYEGKPIFEFDRTRMFRSGLVGFTLHGSLSHYYYHFCEALFPFKDWWVVPAKVAFDQTVWSAVWNSIYFVVLGFLRWESPATIFSELKSTFFPLLTAGWKLWPFAHVITYGVVPVEQRLLWVDCVELIWVTILSTYSNEKSEARISEGASTSTDSKDNSR